ncbi:hypothetical protein [Sphingobacterium sp.]|uniref:hypothetical protein n=1 Tax=Sphingobacterium sp. TaxID=341027 RepID=UPI0028ACF292|nr:hypothetical protein [Sphingobacterium sp.]
MKKLFFSFSVCFAIVATIGTVSNAVAQISEESEPEDGKITCYSTYDAGTTTFTDCNGCNHAKGDNLKDSSTCK